MAEARRWTPGFLLALSLQLLFYHAEYIYYATRRKDISLLFCCGWEDFMTSRGLTWVFPGKFAKNIFDSCDFLGFQSIFANGVECRPANKMRGSFTSFRMTNLVSL